MVNKVILVGRVGQNPEIRSLPNGSRVSSFSLATTEYWKDKNGVKNSKTEWHRIVVYNENMIRLIEKAVKKGSLLYLEGSISTRKYNDQAGNSRTVFEIIIYHDIQLLDSRQNDKNGQDEEKGKSEDHYEDLDHQNEGEKNHINNDSEDDDIPF